MHGVSKCCIVRSIKAGFFVGNHLHEFIKEVDLNLQYSNIEGKEVLGRFG